MPTLQRNLQIANASMKAVSGSSAGISKRNGAIRTMFIWKLGGGKKNARNKACRRASVFSHIQQWLREKIVGKPSRNAKKSVPRSAESNGGDNHAEEAKDRLGWKHTHNPDYSQGAQEAAQT